MLTNKLRTCFKTLLSATPALAIIVLSSCSDEDTKLADSTLPHVTVTTSTNSDVVWNTVKLKLEATDNSKVKSIELKIDGVSMGTSGTSPYEFDWNTQAATDGEHTITGVATDDSGNTKSVDIKATVQNILLEADVPDELLKTDKESGYEDRGFIFLSDNDGNVIVTQEFHNGDHIKLLASDFNGSEFSVTQAQTRGYDFQIELTTFTHINRGTWVLDYNNYWGNATSVGKANLTFKNGEAGKNYYINSNGSTLVNAGNTFSAEMDLDFNPSKLYIKRTDTETGEETYNLVSAVTVGANSDVDLSLAVKSMTAEAKDLPAEFPSAFVSLAGIPATGQDEEIYYLSYYDNSDNGVINTRYPGDAFSSYYSYSVMWRDEDIMAMNQSPKPYDLVPLDAGINLSLTNNKFTIATTGTLDFTSIYTETGYQTWQFVTDKNNTEIIIPQIPEILSDLVNTDLNGAYIEYAVSDFKDFDGYSGLVSYIKDSDLGYSILHFGSTTEFKSIQKWLTNDSGRQSSKRKFRTARRSGWPITNLAGK